MGKTQASNELFNVFMPGAAEIISIEDMTAHEKRYTLKTADPVIKNYQPGQFLEISLFGYGEIPIGYASSPTRKNSFDIVVRKVGRVSTAVHNLKVGDTLYLRGPLGNGFPVDHIKGKNILVIAGGVGLCPTRSLIQYIMDNRKDFKNFTLFYGAQSPKGQLFYEDLANWRDSDDVEFYETVDRPDKNWKGNVGVITNLFRKVQITSDTVVVVCGPPIMYRFVMLELNKLNIPDDHIFLDFERRMKCGIGKCGHCQINDKTACVDGPVFSYHDIKRLEEAI